MDTFCIFIPLGMQQPGIDIIKNKERKNQLCGLASGARNILGHKKVQAAQLKQGLADRTAKTAVSAGI